MISLREITSIVAMAGGIEPNELIGVGQSHHAAKMRAMAFWLAYRHVGLSSTVIGRHFGDRDHATVLTALKSFEAELKTDAELKASADRLLKVVEWKAYAAADGERDALGIARSIYLDPRRAGLAASVIDIHALARTFLAVWDIAQAGERLAELQARHHATDCFVEADEIDREMRALARAIREEMAALCGDAETNTAKQETNNADADH
jgi:hypothetical protein